MYTPARAAYVHTMAVEGIITRNEDLMKELVEKIKKQAEQGKFKLIVRTIDRDEIDCVLALADYGYKVICEPNYSQTNEYVYSINW